MRRIVHPREGGRSPMPPPTIRHPDRRQEILEKAHDGEVFVFDHDNSYDMCPNCVTPWKCNGPHTTYWEDERDDVLRRFVQELVKPTHDGSAKRQKKDKLPWYQDPEHEAAIFSHLMKWKKGELVDPDSGAHPLVHAAWRCLAIACKETGNIPKEG